MLAIQCSPYRCLQERCGDVHVGSSSEIGLDPDAKEASLCHSTTGLHVPNFYGSQLIVMFNLDLMVHLRVELANWVCVPL